MTRTRWGLSTAAVLVLVSAGIGSLFAQEHSREEKRSQTPTLVPPKDLAIVGKLVDLQSYMTGETTGKDPVKWSRECIRRGIPAALETERGLIVLGVAAGRPTRLAEHAMRAVNVRGKLYEKSGVMYLEVVDIRAAKSSDQVPGVKGGTYEGADDDLNEAPNDEPEDEPGNEPEDEPGEEPEPDPVPAPDDSGDSQ